MNITSISKNGVKRVLIFNDTILLVDREDSLIFKILDSTDNLSFNLNIHFSDDGKELSTTGKTSDDGKEIDITLHKWQSITGSELTKPIEFEVNDKRVWIKFRTTADIKNDFRSFHLTIWREL